MLLFALGSSGRRKGGVEESTVCAPNLGGGKTIGSAKDDKRVRHRPAKLSADAQGCFPGELRCGQRLRGLSAVTLPG